MTDYDYGQLETKIGRLKQAAIDAYMKDEGYDIYGDRYGNVVGRATVTRPGTDGLGGGDMTNTDAYGMPSESPGAFGPSFESVRSEMDHLLLDWRYNLPDPADIAARAEIATAAADSLLSVLVGGGGEGQGASNINLSAAVDEIERQGELLQGAAAVSLRLSYLRQLRTITKNHGLAARAVAEGFAGEEATWRAAREDVVATVMDATGKFQEHANRPPDATGVRVALAVVGAAVAGAVAVVTAGSTAGAALGIGSAAITMLSDIAGAAPGSVSRNISGGSYSAIRDSFANSLNQLNEKIRDEEELVNTTMEDAVVTMRGTPAAFAPTPVVTTNGNLDYTDDTSLSSLTDGSELQLVMDPEVVSNLTTLSRAFAGGLEDCARRVREAGLSEGSLGNRNVGRPQDGARGAIQGLATANYRSLNNFTWVVITFADLIDAFKRDVERQDAQSQADLNTLRRTVEDGSGYRV